jgi:hypothetical protein
MGSPAPVRGRGSIRSVNPALCASQLVGAEEAADGVAAAEEAVVDVRC